LKRKLPILPEIFLNLEKEINDFRFNVRNYLEGFDDTQPGFSAKPETLFKLIQMGKILLPKVFSSAKSTEILNKIIIELQKRADNYQIGKQ
jgi:hypothetical protein